MARKSNWNPFDDDPIPTEEDLKGQFTPEIIKKISWPNIFGM